MLSNLNVYNLSIWTLESWSGSQISIKMYSSKTSKQEDGQKLKNKKINGIYIGLRHGMHVTFSIQKQEWD
jgi:hypothetical protein